MLVSIIRLYDLLKSRLGEEEAETLVEILERKVDEKFEEKKIPWLQKKTCQAFVLKY